MSSRLKLVFNVYLYGVTGVMGAGVGCQGGVARLGRQEKVVEASLCFTLKNLNQTNISLRSNKDLACVAMAFHFSGGHG